MATAQPWPLFEVSVEGYDATIVAARTRGAAIYDTFLSYTDCWPDITFREWLGLCRARKLATGHPRADAYDYVRRNDGRDIRHGTRVSITGEGRDLEGKLGTVVHPNRDSTAYAHVVLDGTTHAIIVHPYSVVVQQ